MNWIVKNFVRGLLIVVPAGVTIYLLYEGFLLLDRILPVPYPGLGIVVLLSGIVLVGALASNFIVRAFVDLADAIFTRAPLIRIVYAAIKDLLEAFVGNRKRFDRPVAVSLNAAGDVRTLGFVTQSDLSFINLPGHVYVYLPFAYSMAGSVIVVPAERVQPLDADSASVMALVVSGGISRMGFRE